MDNVTLHAHFDGEQIRLDEPYELQPDTKLLITVLPKRQSASEGEEWLFVPVTGLAQAYGNNEPEYSTASLYGWNIVFSFKNKYLSLSPKSPLCHLSSPSDPA